MTLVRMDEGGTAAVAEEIAAGRPVVVPFPSPLPYVVAGSVAAAVNTVKGRPGEQPVGMALASFTALEPYTALDAETRRWAEWASRVRMVNLFLPVTEPVPEWARPGVANGIAAVTLAWLAQLRPVLDRFGHLYLSSANRTSREVTTTAAHADAEFGHELLVVDGDHLRGPATRSGSAAIVRFERHLCAQLVRDGVNTEGRPDGQAFVAGLLADWQTFVG